MSIRESEQRLLERWKANRPGFVADGVVDHDSYSASIPKILFVLKEVNDPSGTFRDLPKFLLDGGQPKTWDNITRWVEGIRRLPEDVLWEQFSAIDKDRRCAALKTIVVINLKKSAGGHVADSSAVDKIAQEDSSYINEQFSLYEPDIVICGGRDTGWTFRKILTPDAAPRWRLTRRGVEFHEFSQGKFIISYMHPEARVADCLLYYGLVDALRELLCADV